MKISVWACIVIILLISLNICIGVQAKEKKLPSNPNLLQEKIQKLKTAIQDQQKTIQVLTDEIAQKDVTISVLNEKAAALKNPESEASTELGEAIAQKQAQIDRLTKEKNDISARLTTLLEHKEENNSTVELMRERLDAMKSEVRRKDAAISARDKMLDNVKERLMKLQSSLDELNQKNVSLSQERDQFKAMYEDQAKTAASYIETQMGKVSDPTNQAN